MPGELCSATGSLKGGANGGSEDRFFRAMSSSKAGEGRGAGGSKEGKAEKSTGRFEKAEVEGALVGCELKDAKLVVDSIRRFSSAPGSTVAGFLFFFTALFGGVGIGPGCTNGGRKGTQSLYKNAVACATAVIMGETVAGFGGDG